MTIELKIPNTGMGIDEGTIIAWHAKEGEAIVEGELLVEVETAKATEEIDAPFNGTLVKIEVQEGVEAKVGAIIALLEKD